MPQNISEVMTPSPITVSPQQTLRDAAEQMRFADIGDVLVAEGERLVGIVTDRDIVIRAVAEGADPSSVKVADVCTSSPISCAPDTSIEEAANLMREQAIRRLPIVDGDRLVGVVSLGDLAMEADPRSALADISSAPPDE